MAIQEVSIRPQPGMQEQYLASPADIVLGGGKAGAGKTFALLMEPLRHIDNPTFNAVIFRRTYPQIKNEGGLWDTSMELYPYLGGEPKEGDCEWQFPSGATIRFVHMQHEKDRLQWDGAQIAFLGFDQLEHFTYRQFFYMLGRNRSSVVSGPISVQHNPDPDHWLRSFLGWWIDDETGLAIESRAGIVRWFIGVNDEFFWADSREELLSEHGVDVRPKSFTFIPGDLMENQILLKKDPGYLANLQALPKIDRERLLGGNWNVRESAGMFFRREWFEIVDVAPPLIDEVRYWDRAATEAALNGKEAAPGGKNAPSWTVGVRIGKSERGIYYVTDVNRFRGSPLKVEAAIKAIASQDGKTVRIGLEQDPGQAGKAEVLVHVRNLAGYDVVVNVAREAKAVRVRPYSAQAEAGNVKLARGLWNKPYLDELENFDGSDACMSDQTDGSSGAFLLLTNVKRAGTFGRLYGKLE